MTLLKYKPLSELDELPGFRAFEDSLNRFLAEPSARPWTPPVDVIETENELVLKADVPEVDQNDIDIQVENGTLTIKGQRKFEQSANGRGYHRIERSYGSFARSFALPDTVDPENIRAEYKNGVLTVSVAKKELAKPRTIKVEVSNN
jgi:HSP20 family protein